MGYHPMSSIIPQGFIILGNLELDMVSIAVYYFLWIDV